MKHWTWLGKDPYSTSLFKSSTVERPPSELSCGYESSGTLLMFDANDEDYSRLGNALIIRGISEDHRVSAVWPINRSTNYVAGSFRDQSAIYGSVVLFVKDGKVHSPCEGCSDIISRAAGVCDPVRCNRIRGESAGITPPESKYVPPKACILRNAFEYDAREFGDTDKSIAEELSARSKRGHVTLELRRILCSTCVFGFKSGGTFGCMDRQREHTCSGPYLNYEEFAAPVKELTPIVRIGLRMAGTELYPDDLREYLRAENGSAEHRNYWVSNGKFNGIRLSLINGMFFAVRDPADIIKPMGPLCGATIKSIQRQFGISVPLDFLEEEPGLMERVAYSISLTDAIFRTSNSGWFKARKRISFVGCSRGELRVGHRYGIRHISDAKDINSVLLRYGCGPTLSSIAEAWSVARDLSRVLNSIRLTGSKLKGGKRKKQDELLQQAVVAYKNGLEYIRFMTMVGNVLDQ